jgi:ribosome-binding factor A
MADRRRRERLASLIEQIVSELLLREMRDPRIASLTSITAVEVSADVSQARIHVSVMGTEEERRETMGALRRATGFVRSKLGEELTIRHVPEVSFHLDTSLERGDRVLALLNTLQIPKEDEPAPDTGTKPSRASGRARPSGPKPQ